MLSKIQIFIATALSGFALTPAPAPAQTAEPLRDNSSIVVTGQPYNPLSQLETTLNTMELRATGADSIATLITELAGESSSQTGRPVILLNGRRAISVTEYESLPTEAIAQVDVLSPEAARALGYSPGRPVYNLILKSNFAALDALASHSSATDGGRNTINGKLNFARVEEDERVTISANYAHSGILRESSRDIIQSLEGEEVGVAPIDAPLVEEMGNYRSLLPRDEQMSIAVSYSKPLGKILATFSGKASRVKTRVAGRDRRSPRRRAGFTNSLR